MINRLRRNADLRSFFLLRQGGIRRSDNPEQKCRQAGSPQIKSSSSALELRNLTSFDGKVTSFALERTSLMANDTSLMKCGRNFTYFFILLIPKNRNWVILPF